MLQSRGIWETFPNRVFEAQCPFVCTLMWYMKTLVHYLLLLHSQFNMHQLLCMKFLLRETGLMIIFICAPPGIFNSISLLNKRDRLWELRWRCVMRHDKVALTTVCFHPGFDADVFLKSSSSPLTFDPLRISLQVQLAISLIQKNKSVLTSWT